MQLWEAYHVTDPDKLRLMAEACLGQGSARSCKQMVVFVTRQDKWKAHAKAVLEANIAEIQRNSPEDRKAHRIDLQKKYYAKLMPLSYKRCFGLLGLVRKIVAQTVGLFRAIPRQVTEADMRTVVHKSCALAVQTFMLSMSEQGYDTCPLEGFDSLRVKSCPRSAPRLRHQHGHHLRGAHGGRCQRWRYRLPFDEFYHQV